MLPIDVVDRICRLLPAKDRVRFSAALSIRPGDVEFLKKLEIAERFVDKQLAKKTNKKPQVVVNFLTARSSEDAYAKELLVRMGFQHDYSAEGIFGFKRDLKSGDIRADKKYKIDASEADAFLELLCAAPIDYYMSIKQNESLKPMIGLLTSYPLLSKFVMRIVESDNEELFAYFAREKAEELEKTLNTITSYDFLSFDLFTGSLKMTTLVAKYLTIPSDVLQKLIDKTEEFLKSDAAFALEKIMLS